MENKPMKNPSFRHYIFLLLLHHLEGDRTVNSVYHILTGKKSSQTIQDMKWYGLKKYFRMFPYWKSDAFHREVTWLYKKKLYEYNNDLPVLTDKNQELIHDYFHSYEWPLLFDGWKFGEASSVFWRRLALLIQCLSFSLKGKRSFYPVFQEMDVQHWVKTIWPSSMEKRQEIADGLFKELYELLEDLLEKDAMLFTWRLSGCGYTGLTFSQLAEKAQMDKDEAFYRFQAVLHYLLNNAKRTKYIQFTASGLTQGRILTETSKKTAFYLQEGLSMKEIAAKRDLKPSTIEDHLVELASEDPSFPVERYVTPSQQEAIIHAAKNNHTYRLKVIKEALEKEKMNIDYFSIRLTLAFYGGRHEHA